jgi:hypothetical protein
VKNQLLLQRSKLLSEGFAWEIVEGIMEQDRDVVLTWLDSPMADQGLTDEALYQVSDPTDLGIGGVMKDCSPQRFAL